MPLFVAFPRMFFFEVKQKTCVNALYQHCECFLALVAIIETIQRSARAATDCEALQRNIRDYLSSFEALYGADWMTIKFHFLIHYPAFIKKWTSLPNAFVLERKHKTPKRFGNEMRNTSYQWDSSILREVTNHHIATLTGVDVHHFSVKPALVHPHPASKQL